MDIYNSQNPTIKELEDYKEQHTDVPQLTNAINLKIASLKTESSTLTKTMSAKQLFNAHNPIWAKPYSISEIAHMLTVAERISSQQFADVLGQTTDYETISQKLVNILWESYERQQNDHMRRTKNLKIGADVSAYINTDITEHGRDVNQTEVIANMLK